MFNPCRKEAATASLEYEGGEDREVLPEGKKQIMMVVLMVVLRAVIFLCVCVRLMRVVPNIYGFAALQLFGFADGPHITMCTSLVPVRLLRSPTSAPATTTPTLIVPAVETTTTTTTTITTTTASYGSTLAGALAVAVAVVVAVW